MHRRGSCHQNADALPRLPNLGESESPGKVLEYLAQLRSCAVQDSDQPLTEIRELQGADEDIGPVLQSVISGKVPEASFCKGKSREFNQFVQQWELFKGIGKMQEVLVSKLWFQKQPGPRYLSICTKVSSGRYKKPWVDYVRGSTGPDLMV